MLVLARRKGERIHIGDDSKTNRHQAAMTSLFVCWYNFCRNHQTLLGMTPAMGSGLADHAWTLEEMSGAVASDAENGTMALGEEKAKR